MSIWQISTTIEQLNLLARNTLVEHLDIVVTEIGDDYLRGTMPVCHKTHQPSGILHGGASVVLAETLGSIAANLVIDPSKQIAVGLDINANHVRAVHEGMVTGTARLVHRGSTTQIWQIDIVTDAGKLVCTSRLTLAVRDHASNLSRRGVEFAVQSND